MALINAQAVQGPVPGLDVFAFEKTKKLKLAKAIRLDESIRYYARLSLEEFIKQQEELTAFIQQQINDKAKADKEAAREDAEQQIIRENANILAQQERNAKLLLLLKELNDVQQSLASMQNQLAVAHSTSHSVLGRIANQLINFASPILGLQVTVRLQQALATQQQRRAIAPFTAIKEAAVKEIHKLCGPLTKDEIPKVDSQISRQLSNQELMLIEQALFHIANDERKEKTSELLVRRLVDEDLETARFNKQSFILVMKHEKGLISEKEREESFNVLYLNYRQNLKNIQNKYNEDVANLEKTLKLHSKNSTRTIMESFVKSGQSIQEFIELNVANNNIVTNLREIELAKIKHEKIVREYQENLADSAVSKDSADNPSVTTDPEKIDGRFSFRR